MLRPLASQDYPLTECEIYIRESNTCERNVVGLGTEYNCSWIGETISSLSPTLLLGHFGRHLLQ